MKHVLSCKPMLKNKSIDISHSKFKSEQTNQATTVEDKCGNSQSQRKFPKFWMNQHQLVRVQSP